MRKKETWFDLYCDGTGARITLKGVWTSTKKDAVFCQKHGAMVMTCERCGKEFHSERSHAKTCSNACRMAQSRTNRVQIESVTGGGRQVAD